MNPIQQTPAMLCSAFAVAVAGVCLGVHGAASAEDSIEVKELRAALEVSRQQIAAAQLETEKVEAQRQTLVESLAEAVRISEEQMMVARENRLKLQAFGVDLFTSDENSLEQRLLKAVRDLDISRQEGEHLTSELHALSEAFMKYLKATPDAAEADRKSAMASIAEADSALSGIEGAQEAETGQDPLSRVVSIDPEIGLVVVDTGRREGLRVGTPVTVLRGERPIFTAMVVDVRESISGAVLQDRLSEVEDVAVGDGIRLLPNQPAL